MIINKIIRVFFIAVCCCFLQEGLVRSEVKLIITNDVHGYVNFDPRKGRIGYARLKTYIKELEKEGRTVFLLDAGDAFSGSAYAQADHGRFIAKIMGQMGYRVMTPGNHAFDHNEMEHNNFYYNEVLLPDVRRHSSVTLNVVAQNLTLNGQDFPGVQRDPVIILDKRDAKGNGLRLIVSGLITPDTLRPSMKDSLPGYGFGLLESPAATRENLLNGLSLSLKDYNHPEDVVIILSHIGFMAPHDKKAGKICGSDLALVPNVDFVADAHTHTAITPQKIGQAFYGNGGCYLENFLEITIEKGGGKKMELKSFSDLSHLAPDRHIEKLIDDFERFHSFSEVLAELPKEDLFNDRDIKNGNIALGRLICRGMLRASKADMAMHNLGCIRAGLPAGVVTVKDLYDVLPFGDRLVSVFLTGKEIMAILEHGSGHGGYGFPQFYGLQVYAWRDDGMRINLIGVLDNHGDPLEMDKQYKVALNGFWAKKIKNTSDNHGEMLYILKNELIDSSSININELLENNNLFVFDSRAEALSAWEKIKP